MSIILRAKFWNDSFPTRVALDVQYGRRLLPNGLLGFQNHVVIGVPMAPSVLENGKLRRFTHGGIYLFFAQRQSFFHVSFMSSLVSAKRQLFFLSCPLVQRLPDVFLLLHRSAPRPIGAASTDGNSLAMAIDRVPPNV